MILHYAYHLSSRTVLLVASLLLISLSSQMALWVKNPPAIAGDLRDVGSIPGSGRSPGEGNGNPPQYSCLGNPMHREAWEAIIHEVASSQI